MGSETGSHIIPLAVDVDGNRVPSIEKRYSEYFASEPCDPPFDFDTRNMILHDHIEPALQRELRQRGIASPEQGYSMDLVGWVELT